MPSKGRAEKTKKRQPPVKIPLPFESAVKGLLGLSAEDARAARDAAKPAAAKGLVLVTKPRRKTKKQMRGRRS